MKERLKNLAKKLYEYLINNDHIQDANRVKDILDEYIQNNGLSEISQRRLIAMCNPRYLGSLYIKDLTDPYMWWNFLSDIKKDMQK